MQALSSLDLIKQLIYREQFEVETFMQMFAINSVLILPVLVVSSTINQT